MNNEQSPIKEIWENLKYILGLICMGFLYGISSLVFLAMFLQWILEIDITELDKSYLLLIAWAGGIIGTYLYSKNQEEKRIQEQLGKLRRKETVYYPHPKLMERWEKEKQFKEWEQKRLGVNPRSGDPFSQVPDNPTNPRRASLTEIQKEMTKEKEADQSKELLEKLNKEYPLTLHTGAGRLFTTVRRMKAEKEFSLPIDLRSGFAISVETGKAANKMGGQEWESFFKDLSEQLERDYPELYQQLFPEKMKPEGGGEMQIIFHKKNPSNPKNNDKK